MAWQELIVFLCVLAATIYLIRRYAPFLLPQKFRIKSNSCATACGGCAKSDASDHAKDNGI